MLILSKPPPSPKFCILVCENGCRQAWQGILTRLQRLLTGCVSWCRRSMSTGPSSEMDCLTHRALLILNNTEFYRNLNKTTLTFAIH